MQTVQLRRPVTVQADKVVKVSATLESGAVIDVEGPVTVGDYNIVEPGEGAFILSGADFLADLVPMAG